MVIIAKKDRKIIGAKILAPTAPPKQTDVVAAYGITPIKKVISQIPLWERTFGDLGRGKHSNGGYSERGYW